MGTTKTQKKRKASALWLVSGKPPNKAVAKLWKNWRMQAEAADRRVEMRKGKTSHHDQ